jgi:rod shape determining protein RodA
MFKEYIKENFDFVLFFSSMLLVIIGLISIYSATYSAGLGEVFEKQLLWVIFGFIALVFSFFLPIKYLELFAYPLYGLSLILLASVPIIGQTVYGSTSWINFGFFKIQPSEFSKITTVIVLALYLSNKNTKIEEIKYILIAFLIPFVPFVLIMLQPDFGTGTVYLFLFVFMIFWAGTKLFYIIAIISTVLAIASALIGTWSLFIIICLSILVLYLIKENWSIIFSFSGFLLAVGFSFDYIYKGLALYQQKRITSFLDPSKDPLGSGYNAIQAKVAIGSGGLFGKGFMQGTQTQLRFIPKQWTDFIFCVPGEEFGFIGSIIVLLLLFLVFTRALKIAKLAKTKFESNIVIGFLAILFYHTIINIGMAINILPVMGLPLPFMSSGGSLLLSAMIMVGIMLNIYAHRKGY